MGQRSFALPYGETSSVCSREGVCYFFLKLLLVNHSKEENYALSRPPIKELEESLFAYLRRC